MKHWKWKHKLNWVAINTSVLLGDTELFSPQKTPLFFETKKLSLSVDCFNSVFTQNNTPFLGNWQDSEKQAKKLWSNFLHWHLHDKSMSVQASVQWHST